MEDFLSRLNKLIRKHARDRHTVFAKTAGIPPGTFQNYLKGSLPSAENLIRISETYNVNLNWLLTGKGKMHLGESAQVEELNQETKFSAKALNAYFFIPDLVSRINDSAEKEHSIPGLLQKCRNLLKDVEIDHLEETKKENSNF